MHMALLPADEAAESKAAVSRLSHAQLAGCLMCCRYSRDKPRLGDTLDIIKFLCKDFWQAVFKKQVDNLKTNHRVRATCAI